MKPLDQLSLKNKSIKELEDSLSAGISAAMGDKYMVKIKTMNFATDPNTRIKDSCEISISIAKYLDGSFYNLNELRDKF